jgi:hypothetical protein
MRMTILNVKTARAIWLVDARDLNPRGIDIVPILNAIKDRYNFQVFPKKPEEMIETDPKGIEFKNGYFAVGSSRHTIVRATIYGDGIVVDSSLSTDFCEAFLADALTFLSSQFGLTYRPEMVHTKIYTSELIVQTDKDLNQIFSPLKTVRAKLCALTGKEFEPVGFQFNTDPGTSATRPAPFSFEREVGKSFAQRRYYSAAPLRTVQHEELLQEMEALL